MEKSPTLKDPSHPLCFACLEDDMRHFQCHRNSSFFQCEFKSFYILPNTAHSGLNSPSTRSQTIIGLIQWIICVLVCDFSHKICNTNSGLQSHIPLVPEDSTPNDNSVHQYSRDRQSVPDFPGSPVGHLHTGFSLPGRHK